MCLMKSLNVVICLELQLADEPGLDFQKILLKQVLRKRIYI